MTFPTKSRAKRYASVILRWSITTFVVFVITLWVGKYITENFLAKEYTATAVMSVPPQHIMVTSIDAFPTPPPLSDMEMLHSPDLLLQVIEDLKLTDAWAKQTGKPQLTEADALTHLTQILKIELNSETRLANISASSSDPKQAAAIANAFVDRYKAIHSDNERQKTEQGADSLREQIKEQGSVVDKVKANVEQKRKDKTKLDAFNQAQRELNEQQSLLEALNIRLKQDEADLQVPSPIQIITRAEVPTDPTSPDKLTCFLIAVGVAALISLVVGCFVEMILLFIRASEGEHS